MSTKITILIDSREKCPFIFSEHKTIVTNLGKTGADYSILGFSKLVGVERKSFIDYMGSTSRHMTTFMKSVSKLMKLRHKAIIVEGSPIQASKYKGIVNYRPEWIINSATYIMSFDVPILFAGNRELAQLACLRFLENAKDRLRET